MEDLDSGLDADVVIFSDDAGARDAASRDRRRDARPARRRSRGRCRSRAPVEAFTAVCISINIRHKAHSYVKLAGLCD